MHKCYFCKHLSLIILICVCKSFLPTGVIVHFGCFCFTWMSLSSICKSPFFQQIYNVCIVVCVSWFLCECLWMHVCNMSFLLVPKSLWTLPLPIMANQGKLVASWKQMQCHWCLFVFLRPQLEVSVRRSPMEWALTPKQRKARPWEKACSWLPLAKWWNHSLSNLSKAGGTREVAAQAK